MKSFRVAILGCGTVGGGVGTILLQKKKELAERAGIEIELAKIVDLFPEESSRRHDIPIGLYCGDGQDLTKDEASRHIQRIMEDDAINLVVETIGGSDRYILDVVTNVLKNQKHLVTANKALLAKHGRDIFRTASEQRKAVGFEASVCGAIPIVKGVNECFTGDEIFSLSGIMNGTSNYILSKMEAENQSFQNALKDAQAMGYAEADPSLDINGGDAGHKLVIMLKIVFGLDIDFDTLQVQGIEEIDSGDIEFAHEMGCSIKLICYAKREKGNVFATVRPMMVKDYNLLSKINNVTNAVRLFNRYSQENVLIGRGAGSLETGSAIVSDIVFIARYGDGAIRDFKSSNCKFCSFDDLSFPYNITFETADIPGITGIVTTAIGKQQINIDTVSHNRRGIKNAIFSIATMPCTYNQIQHAVDDIEKNHPGSLLRTPKIIPILGQSEDGYTR